MITLITMILHRKREYQLGVIEYSMRRVKAAEAELNFSHTVEKSLTLAITDQSMVYSM